MNDDKFHQMELKILMVIEENEKLNQIISEQDQQNNFKGQIRKESLEDELKQLMDSFAGLLKENS